ncbi:hypothetical protein [Endozoicomonas arenosclerae]|uniref:hypothetical protein n=1 Tax=Endozoicomonas arenosclerae TaxID=1633495 RepID=UPI000785527F|nr:hypothetical protein [Endozoicomonas arenosclerae]
MDKTKYLVCRIAPSDDGGVARLMKKLADEAESKGFKLVLGRRNRSINSMLNDRKYIQAITEYINRLIDKFFFSFRVRWIKNSTVLALHPQTMGYSKFIRLVERNNLYFYIMDNSFFCMKSYNVNPHSPSECLHCLDRNNVAYESCHSEPVKYKRSAYQDFVMSMKRNYKKVVFLTQCRKQTELVKVFFGEDSKCHIVGLDTGEIPLKTLPAREKDFKFKYDFTYHGACVLAKGVGYYIELAKRLPQFKFFIPIEKKDCEDEIGYQINLKNLEFKECTWETGLREAVYNSRITINPSLWSAPIEGALLKSLYYGNVVATVKSKYGFESEINENVNVIRLPIDIIESAALLEKNILSQVINSENKAEYQDEYKSKEDLFSVIF